MDKGFPAFTVTLPVIDPTIANGAFADYLNGGGGKQSSTQNWQLSVQRDVGWNTVVEAAYVANKASHLPAGLENLNQVPIKYLGLGSLLSQDISSAAAQAAGIKSPYPGFSGSVNQALLPFPQFLGITEQIEPLGNSSYNSMQMKVQKRTSNGLAFLVSYTLSKTLTDTSLSGFANVGPYKVDMTEFVTAADGVRIAYEAVGKGEPVVLVLTTEDVPHGLKFKELDLNAKVEKGKPAELAFTPDKVGDFVGQPAQPRARSPGEGEFQGIVRSGSGSVLEHQCVLATGAFHHREREPRGAEFAHVSCLERKPFRD